MTAVGIIPHLNSSSPAAPTGMLNALVDLGATASAAFTFNGQTYNAPQTDTAFAVPNLGKVDARTTATETIGLASNGKLVTLSFATAIAVTLDSTAASWFMCSLKVIGAGTATLTPSTGTLDYTTPLATGQGGILFFDGTNWHLLPCATSGSSFTAAGDLSGTSSTQQVIGILNKLIDGTTSSLADGDSLIYSSSTGKWELVADRFKELVSYVPGQPAAGANVLEYKAGTSMIFPGNFASPNSQASCGTNPTATATYTIYKNGVSAGTLSFSTSGVPTFATTGGSTLTLSAGDILKVVAPGTVDATLADVVFSLVGTRTAAVPSVAVPNLFSWAGTYSGGTTYQPYQVVQYSGNAYVCILTTTGNLPTNATYWNLFASSGGITVAGLQQETNIYNLDAGSANAFSVTLSPAPSVVDGSIVVFRAANANTGASTLTLPGDTGATGGTAQSIVKQGGTALVANDVKANQVVIAVWDNAHTKWEAIGLGGGDTTAKYLVGDSPAPSDLTNALSWPGLYNHPDAPPASAGSLDDEFDAGSLNTSTRWTWVNQGGATANLSDSILGLNAPTNSGDSLRMIVQSAPSTPWEVTAKIELLYPPVATAAVAGICLYDSSGGKIIVWSLSYNAGYLLANYRYTNTTTFSATANQWAWPGLTFMYMRVRDNGTNVLMSISMDGCHWLQMVSESRTAFLPSGANRVGLLMDVNGTTFSGTLCCDWFRRTL